MSESKCAGSSYIFFKRKLDIVVSGLFLIVLIPLFISIAIFIKIESPGPVFFTQKRVGKNNKLFLIYKFRTMKVGTPDLATHLINPKQHVTKVGSILRKTSLDELPQLYNILQGDLSLVGPRPALYNQYDLIDMRTAKGIDRIQPGLTGLAQINGRDDISNMEKVHFDYVYMQNRSIIFDLHIIIKTFFKIFTMESIKS